MASLTMSVTMERHAAVVTTNNYWDNPGQLIGKTIEIDTFGESTDQLGNISLNCPIYKEVQYDK